jgi:hypothetical protein
MYEWSKLELALQDLGNLLRDRGQLLKICVIGGGALNLLGLIQRSTEDIDVVALVDETLSTAEPLPPFLVEAVRDVARLHGLRPQWLNSEPTGMLRHGLPQGFLERCTPREYGGLILLLASRLDQIHLKLYAAAHPRDKHFSDLRSLNPTRAELLLAADWVRTHVSGEGAESELTALLEILGVRDV